eukprot:gene5857-5767_t
MRPDGGTRRRANVGAPRPNRLPAPGRLQRPARPSPDIRPGSAAAPEAGTRAAAFGFQQRPCL